MAVTAVDPDLADVVVVRERHRLRNGAQALAHPLDVAIKKRSGFAEVALDGKRDDHRAPRTADAQRQTPRAGMSSNFDRAIELFDARTLQC